MGGVGESILFVALPGLILVKMAKARFPFLRIPGWVMFIVGCLITIYVIADKTGLVDLVPPPIE